MTERLQALSEVVRRGTGREGRQPCLPALVPDLRSSVPCPLPFITGPGLFSSTAPWAQPCICAGSAPSSQGCGSSCVALLEDVGHSHPCFAEDTTVQGWRVTEGTLCMEWVGPGPHPTVLSCTAAPRVLAGPQHMGRRWEGSWVVWRAVSPCPWQVTLVVWGVLGSLAVWGLIWAPRLLHCIWLHPSLSVWRAGVFQTGLVTAFSFWKLSQCPGGQRVAACSPAGCPPASRTF